MRVDVDAWGHVAVDVVVGGAPVRVLLAVLGAPLSVGPPVLEKAASCHFEPPLLLFLLRSCWRRHQFLHWSLFWPVVVVVVVVAMSAQLGPNTACKNIDPANRYLASLFSPSLCAQRKIFPHCQQEAFQLDEKELVLSTLQQQRPSCLCVRVPCD